jgi:hypothetical protein
MTQQRSRWSMTLPILGVDLVLTASMLALFSVNLTGLRWHEWLELGVCILVPTHMLVNWAWLATTTRRFMQPLPWRARLCYLLNAGLFVSIVVVTLSGLLISEVLFPGLTAAAGNPGFWHPIHTMASNATLVLVGLHLGVYWRNVLSMLRRLISGQWRDAPARVRARMASSRTTV